jgi:long-chain acyl-CoA synthetase
MYSVATSIMVPTHFRRLLDLADEVKSHYALASLVRVGHTGSRCPSDVKEAMIRWWGPVLLEAHGATESGTVCSISSHEWLAHPGSVGRVTASFSRAFAVDDNGNELEAESSGCCTSMTRHEQESHTWETPPRRTLHTFDPVCSLSGRSALSRKKYVYLTDRATDLIVSGGGNAYPAEVEEILMRHPAIEDAAVIALPRQ